MLTDMGTWAHANSSPRSLTVKLSTLNPSWMIDVELSPTFYSRFQFTVRLILHCTVGTLETHSLLSESPKTLNPKTLKTLLSETGTSELDEAATVEPRSRSSLPRPEEQGLRGLGFRV